jgi:hypothetical protein
VPSWALVYAPEITAEKLARAGGRGAILIGWHGLWVSFAKVAKSTLPSWPGRGNA